MTNKLTMKQKLEIINNGGEIDVTEEYDSWKGIAIRKIDKLGKVIEDMNGMFRRLTVEFKDGTQEVIRLNNIGDDPQECHQYEWYDKQNKIWYRF